MVAIEKADAPPPDGSTATNTCIVFCRGSRALKVIGSGMRLEKASMSAALKAFSEPSAEMPKLSRNNIAGSWHQSMEENAERFLSILLDVLVRASASNFRTVSTF